jgi:hypothetical protein
LAYIEWFSKLKPAAEDDHKMYLVSKLDSLADGFPPGDVVPLSSICQTCQLLPDFAKEPLVALQNWSSDTVLDSCRRFYLNSFSSKYAYQTIW